MFTNRMFDCLRLFNGPLIKASTWMNWNTPFLKTKLGSATVWIRPFTLDWLILKEMIDDIYAMTLHPGDVVLDAGAQIGLFSVWCATNGAGKVLAFEPNPANHKLLSFNTARQRHIEVHHTALGDNAGVRSFYVTANHADGSFYPYVGNARQIRTATENICKFLPVDVVKLDVEGAEYELIYAMNKAHMLQKIRELAIEFHYHNGLERHLSKALCMILGADFKVRAWHHFGFNAYATFTHE